MLYRIALEGAPSNKARPRKRFVWRCAVDFHDVAFLRRHEAAHAPSSSLLRHCGKVLFVFDADLMQLRRQAHLVEQEILGALDSSSCRLSIIGLDDAKHRAAIFGKRSCLTRVFREHVFHPHRRQNGQAFAVRNVIERRKLMFHGMHAPHHLGAAVEQAVNHGASRTT